MKLRVLAGSSYIAFSVGLVLVIPFHAAQAQRTIQVPGDAATVQAGINMANTRDTISIAPGTYSGPINFSGKAITVSGSAPGVILDGGSANGPVVTFNSGETRSSILENVTVQNGISAPSPTAGGIFIDQASPTIINSTIQNNQGCGIGVVSGAPLIQGNTVTGNQYGSNSGSAGCLPNDEFGGGGIVLYGAPTGTLNAEIIGNTIEANTDVQGAAGIYAFDAGRPFIENNTIAHNMGQTLGSGMTIFGNTAPVIVQNLVYDNTIDSSTVEVPLGADVGAGLNLDLTNGSYHQFPTYIVNNTFANNTLIRPTRQAGTQIEVGAAYDNISFFNNLIVGADFSTAVDCLAALTQPVAPPTFDHNDVLNAGTSPFVYSGSCAGQTGVNGNISANPNFAANTNSAYPYQLQLPSAAIDSGNNNAPDLPRLDFLGQPRIQNATGLPAAIVDMGVYEYKGIPGVVPPPPSFTLTVNPSSATIQQGKSGTFSVTVTPTATDLGSVLLTCSGLPATASCTFSSFAMSFTSASPQSSTLTISTATTLSSLSRAPSPKGGLSIVLAGLFLIPTLLVGKRGSSNRGVPWMLRIGVICVISSCAGLSGCGPDKYIIIGAPQTYQLTVQASAVNSGLSKQAPVTLVVTQY
jgi:parallel beta-helix repeat protein